MVLQILQCFNPCGVCIDLDGNISVSDINNHKIRKITINAATSEGNDTVTP